MKERLKAVSEELEDFLDVSVGVDAKGPPLQSGVNGEGGVGEGMGIKGKRGGGAEE